MKLNKASLTAEEITEGFDLSDKTILITGCNSGLGFETMRVLALRGARVIGLARTLEKAQDACKRVEGNAIPLTCDLSKPESIRTLVNSLTDKLDAIIACAGVMAVKEHNVIHGVEEHMFVNHVGHFMLITGLLKQLKPAGRIAVYASAAHSFARGKNVNFDDMAWNRPYKPWPAYGYSKLANILFVKELAKRLPNGQTANALHPGIIESNLWRHVPEERSKYKLKPASLGAKLGIYLALSPELSSTSGEYFSGNKLGKPTAFAQDAKLAKDLWEKTERIVSNL